MSRIISWTLVCLLTLGSLAWAEIAPEYYRQDQVKAPEVLTIKVLAVRQSTCWFSLCSKTEVVAQAEVVKVKRSTAGLKSGTKILIRYDHDERTGIAGPRPIRVLRVGETTPAFLERKGDEYRPAARGASFQALIDSGRS